MWKSLARNNLAFPSRLLDVLSRKQQRGNKVVGIALELRAPKAQQDFVILVENKTVLRAVDPKIMERGPHLGRESEIRRGPLLFADDHPKLIHDLSFAYALEKRAGKSVVRLPVDRRQVRNSAIRAIP